MASQRNIKLLKFRFLTGTFANSPPVMVRFSINVIEVADRKKKCVNLDSENNS